jgi:hypothetical protein
VIKSDEQVGNLEVCSKCVGNVLEISRKKNLISFKNINLNVV